MTLSFLRLPPPPDLASQVENFWFMRGASAAAMPDGHRILPDGCMEFVFQLGDPFRELGSDGTWRLQPRWLFVGQMQRRVDIKPSGVIHTVGIHFRPAGVAAFVTGDLSRFTDRIQALDRALGDVAGVASLSRALASCRSAEKMAERLAAFLRRRRIEGDPKIERAVSHLLDGSGVVDLESLAPGAALSERQFRRRFEMAVGLPPKRFVRLIRFQRVFEQRLENDALAWSRVALDCGYYDQAHFNRDFKAFTGARPRDILKDADPLTLFFLSVSSKTRAAAGR